MTETTRIQKHNADAFTKREYKDTLFKFIFGREENKKWLLSLYNALAKTDCTDENEIEINTIEDVIYITRKNDVSFLIGSEMYLLEHQSSCSPNLPLRGMVYFSQLYSKFVEKKGDDLYGTRLVKIPSPNFYVLYNGQTEMPDKVLLKLSDAFESPSDGFEWTATVLNTNLGHNKNLLDACKSLQDYSKYVKLVRDNLARGMEAADAVNAAVDEAIRLGLLEDFFRGHRAEVFMSILTEFDQEKYDYNRRMEGYEDGIQQGEHNARIENAKNFLKMGLSLEQVSQGTGLPLDEVSALSIS